MRSRVDLPQPDGPTSTVNEPSAMSMSTPCRTAVSPKFLRTDLIVTLAICARVKAASPPGLREVSAAPRPGAMRANR